MPAMIWHFLSTPLNQLFLSFWTQPLYFLETLGSLDLNLTPFRVSILGLPASQPLQLARS